MVEAIVEIVNAHDGRIDLTEIDDEMIEGYEFDEIRTYETSTGKTSFMVDGFIESMHNYENLMQIYNFLIEHFC